jgi:hypothetical protein
LDINKRRKACATSASLALYILPDWQYQYVTGLNMASTASDEEDDDVETDDFYSPANFAFYETQPYPTLSMFPYHIRLQKSEIPTTSTFTCELTEGIQLRELAVLTLQSHNVLALQVTPSSEAFMHIP